MFRPYQLKVRAIFGGKIAHKFFGEFRVTKFRPNGEISPKLVTLPSTNCRSPTIQTVRLLVRKLDGTHTLFRLLLPRAAGKPQHNLQLFVVSAAADRRFMLSADVCVCTQGKRTWSIPYFGFIVFVAYPHPPLPAAFVHTKLFGEIPILTSRHTAVGFFKSVFSRFFSLSPRRRRRCCSSKFCFCGLNELKRPTANKCLNPPWRENQLETVGIPKMFLLSEAQPKNALINPPPPIFGNDCQHRACPPTHTISAHPPACNC
jgi:hypothetical protein